MRKSDGTYTYSCPTCLPRQSSSAASQGVINIRAPTTTAPSPACALGLRAAAGVGIPPATPTTCCTRWSP